MHVQRRGTRLKCRVSLFPKPRGRKVDKTGSTLCSSDTTYKPGSTIPRQVMSTSHDLTSYAKSGSISVAHASSLELVNVRRSSGNGNSHDGISTASLLPDELDQPPLAEVEAAKPRRKRLPVRLSSTIKAWWLEVVAIWVSIASLASIAGILHIYQNKPLSSWHYHYQPNSVVSQLTTVARSAMMLAVASCISQSFWLHIEQKPRKILAIQTFDKASRGPAGAALLLASTTKTSMIAILGSFITVATLFMDSSTQQLLRYPFRTEPGVSNGTFPVTQNYVPTFYTFSCKYVQNFSHLNSGASLIPENHSQITNSLIIQMDGMASLTVVSKQRSSIASSGLPTLMPFSVLQLLAHGVRQQL